jgi:predicted nucleotidyltransferase
MLDALFGSASRARLLAVVLAEPRREYHVRELIRLVGGGASSVQRDVDRLEVLGLLTTRRTDGGRRLVAAVESHPLLEPLRTVLAAAGADTGEHAAGPREAAAGSAVHASLRPRLAAVVDALRAAGVESATLFGSATEVGSADAPADLDIVVRLGGPARGRAARYFALRRALEEAGGLPVDLVEEEAIDNPYLRDQIARTGVTLVAAA